jgi:hypothetical protein
MSIDYASDIGKVRLLIPDTDENALIFSDQQLQAFVDIGHGNVKMGAAHALSVVATDRAMLTQVVKTDDYSVGDPAQLVKQLLARAEKLRAEGQEELDKDGDDGIFELVDSDSSDRLFAELEGNNGFGYSWV